MIVSLHMCMPAGDAMRQRFGDLMEIMKRDNRTVIAAMLAEGTDVPDTIGELGVQYVPEQHRVDARGQPVMEIYGLRDMVDRGTWSCGDGVIYEAAVMEEKHGVPTLCLSVAQGDDDLHAIFVTPDDVIDPLANYQAGRKPRVPVVRNPVAGSSCVIQDGRVVCVENDVCAVDERGTWHCPAVPGLSGRRTKIGPVYQTPRGQAFARTPYGAVVPVRRRL